jgi:hypothetical protein
MIYCEVVWVFLSHHLPDILFLHFCCPYLALT